MNEPCLEKRRLQALSRAASENFTAAVEDVTSSRGKVNEADFERLREAVSQARAASGAARLALDEHKREHEC